MPWARGLALPPSAGSQDSAPPSISAAKYWGDNGAPVTPHPTGLLSCLGLRPLVSGAGAMAGALGPAMTQQGAVRACQPRGGCPHVPARGRSSLAGTIPVLFSARAEAKKESPVWTREFKWGRCWGRQVFGKGPVQHSVDLASGQSSLRPDHGERATAAAPGSTRGG